MKDILISIKNLWTRYSRLEQRVTALENATIGKFTCKKCGKGMYRITGDRKFQWGTAAGNTWQCDACGHVPNDKHCEKLDNA